MLTFMRKAQSIWNDESGASAPPAPERMAEAPKPGGRRPKIGLALGAGAARGWCHIGILRELDAAGFRPDIIAGTSIGALIGGCYAAGKLDDIERFALGLTKRRVLSLLDLSFSGGGLFSGARLRNCSTRRWPAAPSNRCRFRSRRSPPKSRRVTRSGCAAGNWRARCRRPTRCPACSNRNSSMGAGCSMARWSIPFRFPFVAPWAPTSWWRSACNRI